MRHTAASRGLALVIAAALTSCAQLGAIGDRLCDTITEYCTPAPATTPTPK